MEGLVTSKQESMPESKRDYIKYKIRSKEKRQIYNRLKTMVEYRLVGGLVFVKVLLKKIEMSK